MPRKKGKKGKKPCIHNSIVQIAFQLTTFILTDEVALSIG